MHDEDENRSVTRKSNKKCEDGFNSLKEFVPEKKAEEEDWHISCIDSSRFSETDMCYVDSHLLKRRRREMSNLKFEIKINKVKISVKKGTTWKRYLALNPV